MVCKGLGWVGVGVSTVRSVTSVATLSCYCYCNLGKTTFRIITKLNPFPFPPTPQLVHSLHLDWWQGQHWAQDGGWGGSGKGQVRVGNISLGAGRGLDWDFGSSHVCGGQMHPGHISVRSFFSGVLLHLVELPPASRNYPIDKGELLFSSVEQVKLIHGHWLCT